MSNSGANYESLIPATIARLKDPHFEGTPTVPTAPAGTNSTQAANMKAVQEAVAVYADVIAPVATGVAATDTTNLKAAIAATPAGGTLFIRNPSAGGQSKYMTTEPLGFPAHIRVIGESLIELWASGGSGVTNTNGPGTGVTSGAGCKVRAAAFAGVVIEQQTAATDVFQLFAAASTVHVENICGTFAAGIADKETGHVWNCTPSTKYKTLPDSGIMGSTWRNVVAAAHDGNHYGFIFVNLILSTMGHLRSYGGGGFAVSTNSELSSYGNTTFEHPYAFVYNVGSGHGFALGANSGSFPGQLGLMTWIRPQAIAHNVVKEAGTQLAWNDFALGAFPPWTQQLISADLENFQHESASLSTNFGPYTEFLGYSYINGIGPGAAFLNPYAAGRTALSSLTSGQNDTAVGSGAGKALTTGGYNAFLGTNAGGALTTTSNNVAVGASALATGVGAANCVAVGQGALATNTAPFAVAVGASALVLNTSGEFNTAVGTSALAANVTGKENTALGYTALLACTGTNNTGAGFQALLNSSTATQNTAFGSQALRAVSTSGNSTAVGFSAMRSNTAANNVAVGASAMLANTSGTANTSLGTSAMSLNKEGGNNTAVGYAALNAITTSNDSTAVGYQALLNATGAGNTAVGRSAAGGIVAGTFNTVVGHNAQSTNNVNYCTVLGDSAICNGEFAVAIGRNASAGAKGAVALGADAAGTGASTTTENAFVLGTVNHLVQVPGTLKVTGAVGFNGQATAGKQTTFAEVAITTPALASYGFTLAQAEALVANVNSCRAALRTFGFVA